MACGHSLAREGVPPSRCIPPADGRELSRSPPLRSPHRGEGGSLRAPPLTRPHDQPRRGWIATGETLRFPGTPSSRGFRAPAPTANLRGLNDCQRLAVNRDRGKRGPSYSKVNASRCFWAKTVQYRITHLRKSPKILLYLDYLLRCAERMVQ